MHNHEKQTNKFIELANKNREKSLKKLGKNFLILFLTGTLSASALVSFLNKNNEQENANFASPQPTIEEIPPMENFAIETDPTEEQEEQEQKHQELTFSYHIQSGDTINSLARAHWQEYQDIILENFNNYADFENFIIEDNNADPTRLQIGQEIIVNLIPEEQSPESLELIKSVSPAPLQEDQIEGKSFMPEYTITNQETSQYNLLNKHTHFEADGTGWVKLKSEDTPRLVVALGTGFNETCGYPADVILKNGEVVPVFACDIKADKDTEATNTRQIHDNSVVEVIFQTESINQDNEQAIIEHYNAIARQIINDDVKEIKVYKNIDSYRDSLEKPEDLAKLLNQAD